MKSSEPGIGSWVLEVVAVMGVFSGLSRSAVALGLRFSSLMNPTRRPQGRLWGLTRLRVFARALMSREAIVVPFLLAAALFPGGSGPSRGESRRSFVW